MKLKKRGTRDFSNAMQEVRNILWLVLGLNLAVCVGKLLVGWSVNSLSMVADGFHSLTDVLANGVGLASVWIASKPADKDHPYGHQKFEVLAALGTAVLMGVACVEILADALRHMGNPGNIPRPSPLSFIVMILTMGISGWISWFESRRGRSLQSPLLVADSAHKASDLLSSGAVLAALGGAELGWGWADLAAAVLVVAVVGKAAWGIVNEAQQVLADHIMVDPARVAHAVKSVPGVLSCHKVRSRGMPGNVFVDLHLEVSPRLTTIKAHTLTHRAMKAVKRAVPGVKEVFIHTEPPEAG
jgi:cation diffusion facilitator family transporter